MARKPRNEQVGGYYHVTSRGNNRQRIWWDDLDCGIWERTLARAVRREGWAVLAYCLMPNHFHLVIRIPFGGLSRGMCLLNSRYAQRVNLRYGRTNHLFGRRFWAKPIESEEYLLGSARYTVLNPVRAGICAGPEEYRWSSYAACRGLVHPPPFLDLAALLRRFSPDPARARTLYSSFVSGGPVPVPGTVAIGQRRGSAELAPLPVTRTG